MVTAADILNPVKPKAATANPAILALEVMIDDIPVLKGTPEEAQGTDLAGTICLALKEPLKASKIEVQLYGAALEKIQASSSAINIPVSGEAPIMIYESLHNVFASSTPKTLAPGAHDIRFAFKLPGTLPETQAGRVQYVLQVVIQEGDKEVAALMEAVRIRRVLPGNLESETLPEYVIDDAPPYMDSKTTLSAPSYDDTLPDGQLPPDYDFKGKARA
ncbi:hypothetical protein BDR26DRAFT_871726 [Obelidium mucronatum]|nr:hypothetical protein BDR26DRAFT_871726 [Obelidium mucronatum]